MAFGLGLALVILAGARFYHLGEVTLRAPWLFLLAAFTEGSLAFASARGWAPPELMGPLARASVFVLVTAGIWANRHLFSLGVVYLGLLLNTLVMALNRGQMPVSASGLEAAGLAAWVPFLQQGGDGVHTLMDSSTRLAFLGDTIVLAPLVKVISPGDVFIVLGIVLVVVEAGLRAKRTLEDRSQPAAPHHRSLTELR